MSALAVPGGRVKLSHSISCNTFLHNTLQPTLPGAVAPLLCRSSQNLACGSHSIPSLDSPLAKGCWPLLPSPGPLHISSCSRTFIWALQTIIG